jgi:hypothetical protein
MLNKLKNIIWVIFAGLGIGVLIRRGYDSILNIPNITDYPLIDFDSILFGSSILFFLIFIFFIIISIVKVNPLQEARNHWDASYPDKKGKYEFGWTLFRMAKTLNEDVFFFMSLLFCFCMALTGDFLGSDSRRLFSICLLTIGILVFLVTGNNKIMARKSDKTMEEIGANLLNLPEAEGKSVLILIFIALGVGTIGYKHISQVFGGGKPEPAIVFLKTEKLGKLPSLEPISGQIVDIVFRRGSKIGIKKHKYSEYHLIVIDQSDIDRIYCGKGIFQLDPSKLK